MALAMPRPFATKSGCYYLNVRVPNELREVARGRSLTFPIGDSHATATVTGKVFVSLRTKHLGRIGNCDRPRNGCSGPEGPGYCLRHKPATLAHAPRTCCADTDQ